MYELKIDDQTIQFSELTWANYKKLQDTSGVKGFAHKFFELGKPSLTPEQVDDLDPSVFQIIDEIFADMQVRKGEWKSGRFELSTPISAGKNPDTDETMLIKGFTFEKAKLGDLYDYFSLGFSARLEHFLKHFATPFGNDKAVKTLPIVDAYIDQLLAKDALFIMENIAEKSQGATISWTKQSA